MISNDSEENVDIVTAMWLMILKEMKISHFIFTEKYINDDDVIFAGVSFTYGKFDL